MFEKLFMSCALSLNSSPACLRRWLHVDRWNRWQQWKTFTESSSINNARIMNISFNVITVLLLELAINHWRHCPGIIPPYREAAIWTLLTSPSQHKTRSMPCVRRKTTEQLLFAWYSFSRFAFSGPEKPHIHVSSKKAERWVDPRTAARLLINFNLAPDSASSSVITGVLHARMDDSANEQWAAWAAWAASIQEIILLFLHAFKHGSDAAAGSYITARKLSEKGGPRRFVVGCREYDAHSKTRNKLRARACSMNKPFRRVCVSPAPPRLQQLQRIVPAITCHYVDVIISPGKHNG